jgi:hypothetical protein
MDTRCLIRTLLAGRRYSMDAHMATRNNTESGLLKAVRAAQKPLPLATDTEFQKYVRKTRMTIADAYRFGASEAQETIVNWIAELRGKELAKRKGRKELEDGND